MSGIQLFQKLIRKDMENDDLPLEKAKTAGIIIMPDKKAILKRLKQQKHENEEGIQ